MHGTVSNEKHIQQCHTQPQSVNLSVSEESLRPSCQIHHLTLRLAPYNLECPQLLYMLSLWRQKKQNNTINRSRQQQKTKASCQNTRNRKSPTGKSRTKATQRHSQPNHKYTNK